MTDDDLAWLDLGALADRIRSRELSAVEVARAMLRRIERLDPALRAYARTTPELALEQASEVDARLARGEDVGALAGVPVAVKDLCWTRGVPTAAGTTVFADFVPGTDATVVRRLREAGAVLLGKLQMTEAAFSAHHPDLVPPRNPWDAAAWTGSSSSGSGVATAAGLCHGSIGTDTGGSIRFPSAACGVTGLKPTWGRVSRFGAFELAASLDHLGPMCRSAADCGLMLGAIAGPDADDPTALHAPVPDFAAGDPGRLDGVRIGFDEAWATGDVEPEVGHAVDTARRAFEALGAAIVPVAMPDTDPVVAAWLPICAAEAAVAHAPTFPSRRERYGPMLAALLDRGLALSATDLQRALLVRAAFVGRMSATVAAVDLLLMPAMPLAAPSLAAIGALRTDPEHRIRLQRYTAPFDMTGQPTITLPAGVTARGLPVAAQLVAGPLREDLLVRAGRAFQRESDWHRRRPPV
jgi:amidase